MNLKGNCRTLPMFRADHVSRLPDAIPHCSNIDIGLNVIFLTFGVDARRRILPRYQDIRDQDFSNHFGRGRSIDTI